MLAELGYWLESLSSTARSEKEIVVLQGIVVLKGTPAQTQRMHEGLGIACRVGVLDRSLVLSSLHTGSWGAIER